MTPCWCLRSVCLCAFVGVSVCVCVRLSWPCTCPHPRRLSRWLPSRTSRLHVCVCGLCFFVCLCACPFVCVFVGLFVCHITSQAQTKRYCTLVHAVLSNFCHHRVGDLSSQSSVAISVRSRHRSRRSLVADNRLSRRGQSSLTSLPLGDNHLSPHCFAPRWRLRSRRNYSISFTALVDCVADVSPYAVVRTGTAVDVGHEAEPPPPMSSSSSSDGSSRGRNLER